MTAVLSSTGVGAVIFSTATARCAPCFMQNQHHRETPFPSLLLLPLLPLSRLLFFASSDNATRSCNPPPPPLRIGFSLLFH
ncbi:hypothetical protein S83_004759 [Arachis hypogaea]|nr:uncharacterized protein DS421_2g49150 [Arachis hypogaea]